MHGDDPLVADFDGERVGLAGHSAGGVVVNAYGHGDPRVDAIASWERAQSTPVPTEPAPTTPSLPVDPPAPPPPADGGTLPTTGRGTTAALFAMLAAALLWRVGRRTGRASRTARRGVAALGVPVLLGAVVAAPVAAQEPDPCVGWEVRDLVSGLGLIENLEPDGRGGMLLSTERDRIERLLPDGTVEVAFEDVPAPGGLRVVDGVLFANSGNTLQAGLLGTNDGTIERIDLDTGARETWADGLTMPNGLVLAADGRAFTSRDVGVDAAVTMVPPDPPREPQRWAEIRDTNGLAIDAAQEWLYAATTFDPLAPVHRVRLDDPTVIELVANLTTVGTPVIKGLDDLTIDGADVLYVTANGSGEVLRLDPATGEACVIASGLGNPTAVKLGAGPGWERDHLYVSAWDGIVRELVPPSDAAPTPLPAGASDPTAPSPPDPAPDTSNDLSRGHDPGALPTTGGGTAVLGFLAFAVSWRRTGCARRC